MSDTPTPGHLAPTDAIDSTHADVLAFVREHQGERVLCAFNLSAQPAELALPAGLALAQQLDSGIGGAQPVGATLQFAPWGVLHARLA